MSFGSAHAWAQKSMGAKLHISQKFIRLNLLEMQLAESHTYRNGDTLTFNPPPTEVFPRDDLRKIFRGCQWMAKVPNGEEKLPKISTG